jgi:hypothetical protein
MDITLMGDVEDEFVFRCVKYPVKTNCQFNNAQVGPDMATIPGCCGDDAITYLFSKLRQLIRFESLNVFRRINLR